MVSEGGIKILNLSSFQSITEIVEKRAVLFPDEVGFIFLNGKGEEDGLTYFELYEEAKKIAAYLQKKGKKGDRVLLLFPQGLDFIKSFIGCLMAGMIAVPSYPQKKNKKGAGLNKIIEDASPSIVLSIAGNGFLSGISSAISLCEIDKIEEEALAYSRVEINKDDIAFLQYTSGSTGTPKGVIVSHGNILHNELSIKDVFKMSSDDVLVGWLPFYHDMGLIGNILQPLFTGFKAILMAPIEFLQSPVKWLEAISRYKATVSGGPNFAYDLCVKSIDQEALKEIDLSSWKVAFNGAEPVSAKTLREFHDKFKSCGFRFSSFYPCYGMAETTLLISGGSVSDSGNFTLSGTELVNCGSVSALDIKIITQDLQEQESGKVGEVIVSGESVTQGYWNDAVKTKENFAVQLKGKKYFKTGDLGIYSNNNLYIAGRIKDLIIINGRNYYPQDIEHLTGIAHDYMVPNSVAAFTVNEKLVVVAEVILNKQTDKEQIINAVISNISTELELPIDELVLVRKGTLSKTTSGKIQRSACREFFLNGKLNEVYRLSSLTDAQNFEARELMYTSEEREILNVLKEELGKDFVIPRNQSFFNYGIDSVVIMRMVSFINERFNTDLSADVLYEYDTIEKLMGQISTSLSELRVVKANNLPAKELEASGLQSSIWINQQKNPNSSGYNIPMFLNIEREINSDTLSVAVPNLLKNHRILQTTFDLKGGKLYQKFNVVKVNVDQYEVAGEKELNAKARELCRRAFDLQTGPLFSISILKNKKGESQVLFVVHHIIVDGTSLMMIVKELEERCLSIRNVGIDSIAISEKSSFEKFVISEQELLKERNSKKQYWKNVFENYTERIKLPVDNPGISFHREGASVYFEFDSSAASKIKDFAEKNKVNLFACLLTGYTVFLNKISGCRDLVVGTPLSLRNKEEYLKASGLFINTLMLRSKIEDGETFGTLVKKVYSNSREAIKNGSYPFGEILKDLNIQGTDTQLALSSVFFNFLDFAKDESGKRLFDVYQSNLGTDINFDMNLYVLPEGDIIKFRLDYCKHFFSDASINQIVSFFSSIVKDCIQEPNQVLANIKIELPRKNNFSAKAPADHIPFNKIEGESIGKRFDRMADEFSDGLAIIGNKETYTYQQVKEMSNAVAAHLNQRKAKNIALFMGHSEDAIFGMLGVLKNGNWYVPIDNDYPEKRILFILEDAGIGVVLTNRENYSVVKSIVDKANLNVEVFNISELSPVKHFTNSEDPSVIAYILYTSGSTGIPKGVVHDQNYILHIAHSFTDSLKISRSDCLSLIPSFSFSASMMDVFGALLSGASLKIIDIKQDGIDSVLSAIEKSELTIYHSVPTIYRALIEEVRHKKKVNLKNLRLIYLAGEPLLAKDVTLFQEVFDAQCILVNGLGCTEYNICCQNFIKKDSANTSAIVSVGYEGIGVETLILDVDGNETNGLVEGEIALKSDFLAKGYWKDEELSGKKFINERLFLTGDIGRKLPDGKLLHLGRKDFQVKIRGQRVELAEVEEALLNISGIDSAVVAQKNVNGANLICAYIVSHKQVVEKEILQAIGAFLPFYMLPQRVIQLTELPLTTTGKIDRRNLPDPDGILTVDHISPITEIEKIIVEICSKVLNIPKDVISMNSSFFGLGGHSIDAIKLTNEINKYFKTNISISEVFLNHFTILLYLSSRVRQVKTHMQPKHALKKEFYDLTNAQLRIWIQSQFVPYNINASFVLRGELDVNAFKRAIDHLSQRHESLRTIFIQQDENVKQKFIPSSEFVINHDFLDLIDNSNQDSIVEEFQLREIHYEFDLEKGPLFKSTIIRAEPNKFLVFITIHHIIADGWSMNIFTRDLIDFYLSEVNKVSPQLSSLDFQFKDYIEWESLITNSDAFLEDKNYWITKFKRGIPRVNLPLDSPRQEMMNFEGKNIVFSLSEQLSDEIINYGDKTVSTFITIVAAFKVLFFKYTNQQDIVLGSMLAGRDSVEWQDQIGMYAKTFLLNTSILYNDTFSDVISKVSQTYIEALQHSSYPIDNLADDLKLTKDQSRSMFFDIMVILHNTGDVLTEVKEKTGWVLSPLDSEYTMSKFDLTFNVRKGEQGFLIDIEYNSSLFKELTISTMMQKFVYLLQILLKEPYRGFDNIDLKTPLEMELDKSKVEINFNF